MPSLVKIRVERGRDLPPMDRNATSDSSTDAYVEIRLENQQQRTTTCRRSLNPVWNEDFQFDFIDDSVLQDAPLELRCMDHDLYSSEAIGVVYIDLNPLIMRTTQGAEKDLIISGWFPLFDTARGVRGSLLVTVKLQFIGNENPFRDSSAGIQFFSSSLLSNRCFFVQEIIGFVEELVVEDDPENSWQDYFLKGNKTSNDNRLKILYNLSAEVRRKLGKKTFECGGNAVLGYSFHFDTESATGIVARAYGTACRLLKADETTTRTSISRSKFDNITNNSMEWASMLDSSRGSLLVPRDTADKLGFKLVKQLGPSVGKLHDNTLVLLHSRASSHTITAMQVMPFALARDTSTATRDGRHAHTLKTDFHHNPDSWALPPAAGGDASLLFQVEVQLLTLKTLPVHVQVKLGGLVLARSVKVVGKADGDPADTLCEWWNELREEIKSHAKTLCCRYVIGYTETCVTHGEVYVLSAMGTAASLKGLSQTTCSLALPEPMSDSPHPAQGQSSLALLRTPSMGTGATAAAPLVASRSSTRDFSSSLTPSTSVTAPPPSESMDAQDEGLGYASPPSTTRRRSVSSEKGRGGATDPLGDADDEDEEEELGRTLTDRRRTRAKYRRCTATHVPYNHNTAPFAFMRLVPCLLCKRKWVPETLLCTTDLSPGLPVRGRGRLLEAKVCRTRKGLTGEADAVKISEVLPFLEYDLQRQITLKLKVLGLNAGFGLACQVQVSNDVVVATAHCTAVYLQSLPAPQALQLMRGREMRGGEEMRLQALQRDLDELGALNRELLQTKDAAVREKEDSDPASTSSTSSSSSSSSSSEDDDDSSLESPSSSSSSSSSSRSQSRSRSSSSHSRTSAIDSSDGEATAGVGVGGGGGGGGAGLGRTGSSARGGGGGAGGGGSHSRSRTKHTAGSTSNTQLPPSTTATSTALAATTKRARKAVYQDDRNPFILEIDEETDSDVISALMDFLPPLGFDLVNITRVPGAREVIHGVGRYVCALRRSQLIANKGTPAYISALTDPSTNRHRDYEMGPTSVLNKLFHETYVKLCLSVRSMMPCALLNLQHHVNLLEDGQVELLMTAMVHRVVDARGRYHAGSFPDSDPDPWNAETIWGSPRLETDSALLSANRLHSFQSPREAGRPALATRSASFDLPPEFGAGKPSRSRGVSTCSVEEGFPGVPPSSISASSVMIPVGTDMVSTVGSVDEDLAMGTSQRTFLSEAMPRASRLETIEEAPLGGSNFSSPQSVIGMMSAPPPAPSPSFGDRHMTVSSSATLPLPEFIRMSSTGRRHASSVSSMAMASAAVSPEALAQVIITPLPRIPNTRIRRYLGPMQLHFLKDSWSVRGDGSLGSFVYSLLSEVNALARAHVAALGGNALLCYSLVPQEAGGRVSRSQGFTMYTITGDAVLLDFHSESTKQDPSVLAAALTLQAGGGSLSETMALPASADGLPLGGATTMLPLRS